MNFTKESLKTLFMKALEVSKNSYSPYSKFCVGAALLFCDESIVTGTNVENRSFGLTNCAERSAVYSAVSQGKKEFCAVAIATPSSDYPVGPCGACRQVLTEFAKGDVPVIFGPDFENSKIMTLSELYPSDSLHELGK